MQIILMDAKLHFKKPFTISMTLRLKQTSLNQVDTSLSSVLSLLKCVF